MDISDVHREKTHINTNNVSRIAQVICGVLFRAAARNMSLKKQALKIGKIWGSMSHRSFPITHCMLLYELRAIVYVGPKCNIDIRDEFHQPAFFTACFRYRDVY